MGYMYLLSGQASKAAESFESSLKVDSSDSSYRIGLARSYWNLGYSERANEVLESVVKEQPSNAVAWSYRGIFDSDKHNWDEAVLSFTKAVSLDPANIAYRFELAASLRKAGHIEDARKQYLSILQIDPGNTEARRLLDGHGD